VLCYGLHEDHADAARIIFHELRLFESTPRRCPNAGFVRQLRALDVRLQRARCAILEKQLPPRGRRDALMAMRRRLVEWDASLPRVAARLPPVDADAEELAEDEPELVNSSFLRSGKPLLLPSSIRGSSGRLAATPRGGRRGYSVLLNVPSIDVRGRPDLAIAATRRRGISASRPRRRRDPSPH